VPPRTISIKLLKWLGVAAALSIGALYVGDYLEAEHRMSGRQPSSALGSVQISPTYVIPHKDGRAEIVVGDTTVQPCLHSLFPHFGYTPCWYLKRTQPKQTIISQSFPHPALARHGDLQQLAKPLRPFAALRSMSLPKWLVSET
jgi:hypothetical protein